MTDDEWRYVAQSAADHFRKKTGAVFTVVLFVRPENEAIYMGAQVPTIEILKQLLRTTLANLEDGSATIVDRRPK